MIWLRVLVGLLDLYLLASLGSWFALRFVLWRTLVSGRTLSAAQARLVKLREELNEHLVLWPREPRPGRYAVLDQLAAENLAILHSCVAKAENLLPSLISFPDERPGLCDALLLRTIHPLAVALRAWRDARTIWELIDRGNAALAVLEAQAQAVREVPARTRAGLNELRAEAAHLSAILEAVVSDGMVGLEQHAEELLDCQRRVEQTLDALERATDDPQAVYEADREMHQIASSLQRLEHLLDEASQARGRTQSLLTRVYTGLRLAEERWEGMRSRGAKEPSLGASLEELRARAGQLPVIEGSASLTRYRQVTQEAAALDGDIQSFMAKLDELEAAMRRSSDALAEARAAVDEARAVVKGLAEGTPAVLADTSLTLLSQAEEMCEEAQALRGQGTFEAYRLSLSRSDEAMRLVAQAHSELNTLPQKAEQSHDLASSLTAERFEDLTQRLEATCQAIQEYPLHWERRLQAVAAEAARSLRGAEEIMNSLPVRVRAAQRFQQSELDQVLASLAQAAKGVSRANELATALETSLADITSKRQSLERAIKELADEQLPALEAVKERMLPELRQRLEIFASSFRDESTIYQDPSQVDYDEALECWLPAVRRQIKELAEQHSESVQHYRRLQTQTLRRIQRLWGHLQRLDPYQMPGPQEDIRAMAEEIERWRTAVMENEDSPVALSNLLGREASAIERRLEATISEIEDGRERLAALSREYLRYSESAAKLEESIRQAQSASPWPGIVWDTRDAEAAWLQAQAEEQESQTAPTLLEAIGHLQRAVAASRRAEHLYQNIERQMSEALERLREELQACESLAERARRLEGGLRQEQRHADADQLAAVLASVQQTVAMAEDATTFEDALRYLRTARTRLDDL